MLENCGLLKLVSMVFSFNFFAGKRNKCYFQSVTSLSTSFQMRGLTSDTFFVQLWVLQDTHVHIFSFSERTLFMFIRIYCFSNINKKLTNFGKTFFPTLFSFFYFNFKRHNFTKACLIYSNLLLRVWWDLIIFGRLTDVIDGASVLKLSTVLLILFIFVGFFKISYREMSWHVSSAVRTLLRKIGKLR